MILFATKTCPNCKIAAEFLDKAGFIYEKLYADENLELVSKYGIKQAPTLVVVENGVEVAKAANLSNIRKFIETSINA
jgi:ribonucleoside-triphosphate reductase